MLEHILVIILPYFPATKMFINLNEKLKIFWIELFQLLVKINKNKLHIDNIITEHKE